MANLVRYPVPLGGGEFCYLLLPNPLDWHTANRVITYIQTLWLPVEGREEPEAVPAVREESR